MLASTYPALVLNADFTPVTSFPLSIWDFGRTMRNVMKDRVVVLETYNVTLHSQRSEWNPPSVVALREYVRRPSRVSFTRLNVFMRDGFCCQYCGHHLPPKDLTFDHVVPSSRGGGTNWTNIVSACVPCNTAKADRQDMRPRVKPFVPGPHDLARKAPPDMGIRHASWRDYLYWSGVLESN
jgi:5-methylcytosine-specific restriction endonuclease McrA